MATRSPNPLKSIVVAIALCALALNGCASSSPVPAPDNPATVTSTSGASEVIGSDVMSQENLKRLDELWQARAQAGPSASDYPLGRGDQITISVPGIPDLAARTVIVSPTGDITLPVLGRVKAAGLSETQLHDELISELGKYMYNPQVDVSAQNLRSRQVAVVGNVKTPGLITLVGPNESLLDVLTRAGGMYGIAADQIVLIPGNPDARAPSIQELATLASADKQAAANGTDAGTGPQRLEAEKPEGSDAQKSGDNEPQRPASFEPVKAEDIAGLYSRYSPNSTPILIPIRSTSLTGNNKYLNLPVRPGDVIVVPGGGNVAVTGWVYAPGSFAVSSGMTVLSAVGAAGGPMYAADTEEVRLVRTQDNGQKVAMSINLRAISKGQSPDIPVRGNDVIDVPYSSLKIGPYIFYNVLTRLPVPIPAF